MKVERDGVDELTGLMEVGDGLLVDGEVTDGGSVFRAHVADGGPVGDGQLGDTRTEELDEFTNDSNLHPPRKNKQRNELWTFECWFIIRGKRRAKLTWRRCLVMVRTTSVEVTNWFRVPVIL